MYGWLRSLGEDLATLEAAALRRQLEPAQTTGRVVRRGGRELVNLCGNDYLALAGHPQLAAAAIDAIQRHGTGAGSSRLVGGHHRLHAEVEARFARFKHAEAALLCPTGYVANLAALGALARRGDLICLDRLDHASLIDAARSTTATVRVYPHGDLAKLARLLARAPAASGPDHAGSGGRRRFIVTDSVFSLDGDCADLPGLCDLADRHEAILVVDEAHATGVLGDGGAGLAQLQGVANRIDVTVSTASKALGGLGGIITARQLVVDTIVNRARPFIYTTAVPPAQAAVLGAALEVLDAEPWRRRRVAELAIMLRTGLSDAGLGGLVPHTARREVPIVPIVVGPADAALELAAHLEELGLFVAAIRPPSVPAGSARLRVNVRADLCEEDLRRLVDGVARWSRRAMLSGRGASAGSAAGPWRARSPGRQCSVPSAPARRPADHRR